MPLSQSLITPDLALAFEIRNPNHSPLHHPPPHPLCTLLLPNPPLPNSSPILTTWDPRQSKMSLHAPSSGLASCGPHSSTRDLLTLWLI
ncbi:hypothetical protein V6N13_125918 [Hibiscus sabdariffa]|uniref:Uncharacterized protein n=1 Tax=Hibiscus sabdariffa TaxID=183260 RepID=A0ABR2NX60_9ROSI